jgi:hypothetical protein
MLQAALHPDELGSCSIPLGAVLIEPISEHKARSIVVGMLDDVVEKRLLLVHAKSRC